MPVAEAHSRTQGWGEHLDIFSRSGRGGDRQRIFIVKVRRLLFGLVFFVF